VLELPTLGAAVVVVVLLGLVVDDDTVALVVLPGIVVDVVVVVVVDLGGGVVVVVVVVVAGVAWETGLELDDGSGGYSRYRAPNPRKAAAMSAVDRRRRNL
jgi:hypothetical protein